MLRTRVGTLQLGDVSSPCLAVAPRYVGFTTKPLGLLTDRRLLVRLR